jgi:uncharacterized protein (DUF3820 family)
MKIDLSDLDESYQSSESGYAGALPSGIYKARLISAEVSYSKNNNRQVKWFFEGEMPSGELGHTMKFSPLLDKGFGYLKDDLRILGIVLGHLNEIHDILRDLVGSAILIEVQDDISTGYHKVDFIKKLSGPKR